MVSTRRTPDKKENSSESVVEHVESNLSPREIRRRKREELRSKSKGVGLSISSTGEATTTNKKIVFDEDEEIHEDVMEQIPGGETNEQESDVDDDDQVEEMKSSVALEQEKEKQHLERKTALQSASIKRKRSRKSKEIEKGEEFDSDFFEQIDAEREESRKRQKEMDQAHPSRRHTTFVFAGGEHTKNVSVQSEHGIDVVVLGVPEEDGLMLDTAAISQHAQIYSRNTIRSGSDGISEKQRKKIGQAGQNDSTTVERPHWKRSKKMNRLLNANIRNQRKTGKGQSAPVFVVQM